MADKKDNNVEEERQRFLQSILNRGPNKRQIKPVENSPLLQFVLGEDEEDEDEDEDFDFDEHAEAGSGSDDDEQDADASKVEKQNVPANDDDDDDDDSDYSEEEAEKGPTLSVGDLIAAMQAKADRKPEPLKASSDVVICGICMDDVSDEGDEIVECDNCGITVHEGCYGNINEQGSESDKSNDSDSPTEPWFCDACKAGVQPDCELCPNLSGIFKETDTGQWVHLLCALYTPGVAFVKPESLECVTLSELPSYKWGAKECSLCEDERFSRTGVCVGCDAGLCRTYFHVTCAQIHGLLSDVPEECDEDVADPLYAHCKQHADKTITKGRRRAWLAYNARFKKANERKTPEEKERIESCLNEIQTRYKEERSRSPIKPLYTPTEKVPRLLSSCPGACRQLFKKAVLLGFTTEQTRDVVNVRRKWFVPPSMTCEFVNYYHDRDARVRDMQERQAKLEINNQQLQEEEQKLREKVDKLTGNLHGLNSTLKKQREEGLVLHQLLCQLADQDFSLPEILKSRKTKRKMSETSSKHIQIHPCAKCNEKTNPHLMTECDTCHNYYHLACVDPPLTRMPRKSAKCLWQCSECDPSESEEEIDVDVDDNTPISQSRQRRTIKEPTKFTPDKGEPRRMKVFRKRKASQDVVSTPEAESVQKKPKVEKPKKRKEYVRKEKVQDLRTECFKCKKKGDNHTLARCDKCKQCYHFGCLDPPVKSNPKKRGYMWYCTDCDESEEEEEEEAREEKEEKMEVSEGSEQTTKKEVTSTT